MKVVICGAGEMGRVHFDTFSAAPGVTVTAVADPVAERVGRYSELGVHTWPDAGEMLSSVDADVAVIATPPAFHAELAIKALRNGMHVFCEKPMARTTEDGQAMVEAAEKAKRTLAIGYVLRYHDFYRLAADYVRQGKLGTIGTVRTSRCAQRSTKWHTDMVASGGATFELLTHDLDWLSWAMGGIKRIFARGLAKGRQMVERDYCLVVARLKNGAVAHLEGSLAEIGDFYVSYEIAGSAGLLSYDTRTSTSLEASLLTAEGVTNLSETPQNQRPFARQIDAFIKSLERGGGEDYEVSGVEGLKTLRLTAAAYESIQTGLPVEL